MDEISVHIRTDIPALAGRMADDVLASRRAGMTSLVMEIDARAVKHIPVVTSNLVNSTATEVADDGATGRCYTTNNAPYAVYVHQGTGLFGPNKKKIVPKKGRALKIPGVGYRKSSKGQKPQPFYTQALAEIDPSREYEAGMMNFIRSRGWTG